MSKIIIITLSILLFGGSLKSQTKIPPKKKQTEFKWPEGRDTFYFEYLCDTLIREVPGGYWVKISCTGWQMQKKIYTEKEQAAIDSFYNVQFGRLENGEIIGVVAIAGGIGTGGQTSVIEYFTPSLKRKD